MNLNIENIFDYFDNIPDINENYNYFKLDKENQEILFYDSNKKLLTKYKYQILGKTNNTDNILHWYWGWSLDFIKSKIILSKKLFEYGLNIDSNTNQYLKQILVNSNIKINNNYSKELIIATSLYLLKHNNFFTYKIPLYDNSNNNDNKKDYIYKKYYKYTDDYFDIKKNYLTINNENYDEYVLLLY